MDPKPEPDFILNENRALSNIFMSEPHDSRRFSTRTDLNTITGQVGKDIHRGSMLNVQQIL